MTTLNEIEKKQTYLDLYKELLKTLDYFYKIKDYNIG